MVIQQISEGTELNYLWPGFQVRSSQLQSINYVNELEKMGLWKVPELSFAFIARNTKPSFKSIHMCVHIHIYICIHGYTYTHIQMVPKLQWLDLEFLAL